MPGELAGMNAEGGPRGIPCELLSARLRFDTPDRCLSEFGSTIGITMDGQPGIAGAQLNYCRNVDVISADFCRLNIAPGSESPAPVPWTVQAFPYGSVWRARRHGMALRVYAGFTDTDLVVVSVEARSSSSLIRDVGISFSITLASCLSPEAGRRGLTYDNRGNSLRVKMIRPRTDRRDPRQSFPADLLFVPDFPASFQTTADPFRCHIVPLPPHLPVGSVKRNLYIQTIVAGEPRLRPSLVGKLSPAASPAFFIAAGSRRWKSIFAKLPHPSRVNDDIRRLYYHAAYTLMNNLRAPSGHFRPFWASFPSKGHYCAQWLWDACFQAQALALYSPQHAKDSMRLLFARQRRSGAIPLFITERWDRPGGLCQPPVTALSAWEVYRCTGDLAFLRSIYPGMVRWNSFWYRERNPRRDGLCVWAGAVESGWDNSPRFRDSSDRGSLAVAGADLNSYLVVEADRLERIARELGNHKDAAAWSEEHDRRLRRLMSFYCPEDNLFYDTDAASGRFIKTKTLASFLPLWAGCRLPGERSRDMIRDHLLNPSRFGGHYPFPVSARDEATFSPRNYWRGPIWLNTAYWMLELLAAHGFAEEADAAATRLLKMCVRAESIHEYYDADTGAGLGVKELGWSAAFIMKMILRHYRHRGAGARAP